MKRVPGESRESFMHRCMMSKPDNKAAVEQQVECELQWEEQLRSPDKLNHAIGAKRRTRKG